MVETFDKKIDNFERTLESTLKRELYFANKVFYDNDNTHEITISIIPFKTFEMNTGTFGYVVNYRFSDKYRDIEEKHFKIKYDESSSSNIIKDFCVIFNKWKELKKINNNQLYNKNLENFIKMYKMEEDFCN